jgi:hypothetical protein
LRIDSLRSGKDVDHSKYLLKDRDKEGNRQATLANSDRRDLSYAIEWLSDFYL